MSADLVIAFFDNTQVKYVNITTEIVLFILIDSNAIGSMFHSAYPISTANNSYNTETMSWRLVVRSFDNILSNLHPFPEYYLFCFR